MCPSECGVEHVNDRFFFKQKTAYVMRIGDCSSDVCSSDLHADLPRVVDRRAKKIEPGRAKAYLIAKGGCCPLCGAPHAGDQDAEYHGNLTEQHVRPLHDLASDFSCADSSWTKIGRESCRGRVCQYV